MSLRPKLRRVVTFCVCRYWVVARLVTGRVRAHSCVRETCVRRLHAAWGLTICRSSLPFARGCRVGVWVGFVGAALLPAVGTCGVLAFGAVPGRCCFLRVTLNADWIRRAHPNAANANPHCDMLSRTKPQTPPALAVTRNPASGGPIIRRNWWPASVARVEGERR